MPLKQTRDRRHTAAAGRGPDGPTARIMPPPTCSRPTSTGATCSERFGMGATGQPTAPPTSDGHRNRPTANPANVLERFGYWCNRSQPRQRPTLLQPQTANQPPNRNTPNRNTPNQPPACWHEGQQEQTNGQHVCSQPNQPRQPQTGNRPTPTNQPPNRNRPTANPVARIYIYNV